MCPEEDVWVDRLLISQPVSALLVVFMSGTGPGSRPKKVPRRGRYLVVVVSVINCFYATGLVLEN